MSEADLQTLREAFEAFNSQGTEAFIPYIHPEAVFTTPPELSSEPDTYRGHDGVRRYFDSFYEAMDRIRFVPSELQRVGGVIVGGFVLHARGKSTGIEAEQEAFGVFGMRDGKLFSIDVYPTMDAARAAAESAD